MFHWARKNELRPFGFDDTTLPKARASMINLMARSARRFSMSGGYKGKGLYAATDPSASCSFGYDQSNSETTPKVDRGWVLARIRLPAGTRICERGAPITEDPTILVRAHKAACFKDGFYEDNFYPNVSDSEALKSIKGSGLEDADWKAEACEQSFEGLSHNKDFTWAYPYHAFRIDTDKDFFDRTRALVMPPDTINKDRVRAIFSDDYEKLDPDDELKFIATYVRRTRVQSVPRCAKAFFPGVPYDGSPAFEKRFQEWIKEKILTSQEFSAALEVSPQFGRDQSTSAAH